LVAGERLRIVLRREKVGRTGGGGVDVVGVCGRNEGDLLVGGGLWRPRPP